MLNRHIHSKAIWKNFGHTVILNETALEEETKHQAEAISNKVDPGRSTEKSRKYFINPGNPCDTVTIENMKHAQQATYYYNRKLNQ